MEKLRSKLEELLKAAKAIKRKEVPVLPPIDTEDHPPSIPKQDVKRLIKEEEPKERVKMSKNGQWSL